MSPVDLLESIPLFADMAAEERADIARLMRPFAAPAGCVLFREAEPGDELYILQSGRLEAARRAPGDVAIPLAVLGPGAIVGEMSLIGPGKRTATMTALEDTTGWTLGRAALEVLRNDPRPGSLNLMRHIGQLAAERLVDRYLEMARALGPRCIRDRADPLEETAPIEGEAAYLGGTLFFSRLTEEEIESVISGLRWLHAPRGALIVGIGDVPPALHVVVRGAIEVTVRGGPLAQRVRLAGPGRAIGRSGLLERASSVVECRARERTVLLELPWERVDQLLSGTDSASRAFSAALNVDTVRALTIAERPTPRMTAAADRAVAT